jgi:tRNA threonylcarbamoyladenosine biosynthesis protein TsaE
LRESALRLTPATAGETRAIGARLAAALLAVDPVEPLVIGLSGDLGAGKTTLVGGFLAALGHVGPVRSPTYALVEPYRLGGRDVVHCDLYRLRDPDDLEDLGLRDALIMRSVLLIEWPERAAGRLGTPDVELQLAYYDDGRQLTGTAASDSGRAVLDHLRMTPA